jgi:hypothetical protein
MTVAVTISGEGDKLVKKVPATRIIDIFKSLMMIKLYEKLSDMLPSEFDVQDLVEM